MNRDVCEHFVQADLHCEKCKAHASPPQSEARRARGRKAIDGVTQATERVNIVLTRQHREMLEQLAPYGFSLWVRQSIERAWHGAQQEKINGA